jgi:hypothetical protein
MGREGARFSHALTRKLQQARRNLGSSRGSTSRLVARLNACSSESEPEVTGDEMFPGAGVVVFSIAKFSLG